MSAYLKSSDDCPKRASNMEHNLVSRSSSREKTSNAKKEKALTLEAHQNSKFKEKKEDITPFARPCIDQHNGLKHQIDDEHVVQVNSSGSFQKQQLRFKTKREDELVKHMSNLPAYLQRVEKQKNVQEKALNFGVLDWKRLEKWKYNEHMPVRGHRKVSSIGNSLSMPSVTPGLSKTSLQRKQASDDLHLNLSIEVRLPNCVQNSQTTSLRTVAGQQTHCQKVKFSRQSHSQLNNNESKKVEANQKNVKENVVLSSKQVQRTSSLSSLRMTDHCGRRKTTTDNGTSHSPKYPADEPGHIVLLVPKLPPKKSSSQNLFAESRKSCDGELADYQKRFSDCFSSQELHSGQSYDEIPHSCPLPASVSISQGMQSDICTRPHENDPLITSRPSNVKCQETKNSNDDSSVSVETSKRMDIDTAKQSAVNGRHSSPNRRFSFSLGRLSRSFSFKESSTVPKLSSTYMAARSGPVNSEVLAGNDDTKVDKAHAGGRGRSSPFRRLLHPILKPKGAHSARPVQTLEKDLHLSTPEPIEAIRPLQDGTHQKSTYQALLQLTIKNGLPFLKFMVGESSDILAAVRNLPKSGKTDCSLIYRFYSVREIKKKAGGWIGHGSKDKDCSFGYDIVAQMKISCLSDTIKEAILYNVDIEQGDKGSPEVLPNQEIAAILVRDPAAKLNCKGKNEHDESKEKGFVRCSAGLNCDGVEKENFGGTLVILPGGSHSLPNEGAPSSIIDRWKSGGLCDCGGWDIGCKLRVLTNHNKESNGLTPATGCSVPERIDLFIQGGEGRSQPSFSLAPLKDGFYSVECNASIPLLEAFSICVAVITNQKLPDILDMNLLPEAEVSAEAMTKTENIKNPNKITGRVPAKYVPSPPPSPAGRI